MTARIPDFLAEQRWRGLIHQATHEEELAAHLRTPGRLAYVGFDPTANSLTIGNLMGIMTLVRFALAGHRPVVVMGGGTGMIGDPSGKSAERQLMTVDVVQSNVRSQRRIFEGVFTNSGLSVPPLVNNHDWLGKLGYLETLRDIGKHFSVNMMIQKESVKERLHNRDQGISYTEFSYMILQAYDFAALFRDWRQHGLSDRVTLQMGGSDQFGNIVCGIDLIRRFEGSDGGAERRSDAGPSAAAFGVTWPLVTKADGGKFGKTESGAIWLTRERTSPYAFYQFWLNAEDADVPKFLRYFTLLPKAEVEALEAAHTKEPGAREAHRALARHMTTLVHGETETQAAETAAKALFSGDIAQLPLATLEEVLASAPSSKHDRSALSAQDGSGATGIAAADLLVTTGVAKSKGEARQWLKEGSISINGKKMGPEDRATAEHLLHGSIMAIRRGKRNWHVARWN